MAGLDSYVRFLSHFNGVDGSKEIQDSGNTGHIVTQVGTATLSLAQAKIGLCSLLLDGNSDYIYADDSADWTFGSGDFTIDLWVYFNSVTGWAPMYYQTNGGDYIQLGKSTTGDLYLSVGTATGFVTRTPSSPFVISTWYHIAFVRTSGVGKFFVNGTQAGADITFADTIPDISAIVEIGYDGSNWLNGYIDEYRVSKGLARWTTTFTPQTSPYVSDANTQLLLHMESLDVSSATAPKIPTFVGTAQLDTAQYEDLSGYTTTRASLLLDGNSDYVTVPTSVDFNFSADYTIDMWVKTADKTTDTQDRRLYNHGQAGNAGDLDIYIDHTSGVIFVHIGTTAPAIQGTTDVSNSVWHHIAVARSGSSTKLFVDGTQEGSTFAGTDDLTTAVDLWIGAYRPTGAGRWNGWIDELRISKGIARWTSNFTPPTSEYSRSVQRIIFI